MSGEAIAMEETFNYVNLKELDPNYSVIDEGQYTLQVIKLAIAKTNAGKPYLQGTFAVTKDLKFSARRLWHNFWNITDNSSRDAKDLAKLAQITGVQQDAGFEAWVEAMTQIQPTFKAPVKKQNKMNYNKETKTREEIKDSITDLPVPENVIDFRNVQIAN